MRRVLERILHHGLSGAFLVWLNVCNVLRDLDRDRCHLRKFMERVIRRLLLQPLASAWNIWAIFIASSRLNTNALKLQQSHWLKQMMLRRTKRRTSNGFNKWKVNSLLFASFAARKR